MFYRTARHPFGIELSPFTARLSFIALYTLYPAGCLLRLFAASDAAGAMQNITGFALVLAALAVFLLLAGSSLQRRAQEEDARLDERELTERYRATTRAYWLFALIVVLGTLYLVVQRSLLDRGIVLLWAPQTEDQWNAVFGGVMLLTLTLPAAIMAFQRRGAEEG